MKRNNKQQHHLFSDYTSFLMSFKYLLLVIIYNCCEFYLNIFWNLSGNKQDNDTVQNK